MNERDRTPSIGATVVIFIAFALVAVVLLSSTLLNALAIKSKVRLEVNPAVQGINSNLNSVPLLNQTNALANQILSAAKPLSSEAGQIVSATNSINTSVTSIHNSATAINASVSTIDGHVTLINGNLAAIDSQATSINNSVNGINSSVSSVGSHVNAISASVAPINASVHSIDGSFTNLLPVTVAIRGVSDFAAPYGSGVAGIDNRASAVITLAGPIQADTTTIAGAIGTINTVAGSINGHAANIDNSNVLKATELPTVLNLLSGLGIKGLAVPAKVSPAAVNAAPTSHAAVVPAPKAAAVPSTSGILPNLSNLTKGILPNVDSSSPQDPNLLNNLNTMLSGLGMQNLLPGA